MYQRRERVVRRLLRVRDQHEHRERMRDQHQRHDVYMYQARMVR